MDILLALLLGYVFGSIPFGLLLTKMAGMGDVRSIGSGNIGATNVLRTGNKWLAAATLLFDLVKGLVPVLLAWHWLPEMGLPAMVGFTAVGAILGHCFPVWLGFKGGKGVATLAGVCFGVGWPVGVAYALVWLAMLAISRISSLSGMTAAIIAPVVAWFTGYQEVAPFLAAIAVLILWLHRANIGRLRAGKEPKIGSGK